MHLPFSRAPTHDNPYSRLTALERMGVVEDYAAVTRMHVVVVGLGGVGSVAAEMLVRLGVARLSLFDYDRVELANMNRMFYMPDQVSLSKPEAAIQTLLRINPALQADPHAVDITHS
jgi:ubiquitin-like modifier-activating enzyme 5